MNQSKIFVGSMLAAALVVAGLLVAQGVASSGSSAVATSSGNSGPVKPVPWKRG